MELTDTDQMAIRSVIGKQLQAFQNDDADTAFSCASPAIQTQFGTAEHFLEMAASAYRPVYRPRSVMFESVVRIDGKVAQQVLVMGPDGGVFMALYVMQLQLDSSWRINGCFLNPIQEQSV